MEVGCLMNTGQTVFTQVMARIPHWEFQRAYAACGVPAPRRDALSPWDHFLTLGFAQMTFRESLRDIEACLNAQVGLAYHMGFRSRITRSALSHANEQRDWRPWEHLAGKLMPKVRALYFDEPNALDLDVPVIAVDSSIIDLSFALCPWANWTGTDAAVKLHTALDLRGPIPAFFNITPATFGDVCWLDELPIEPGAFYIMDRGYIDFRRLRRIAKAGNFFVIRDRPDVRYYVAASRRVDRTTNLRSDQSIRLNCTEAPKHWPGLLRRVSLYDFEHSRRLAFWTNQWAVNAAIMPSCIVTAGKSNCSFAGSSTACGSRYFMVRQPTPSGSSCGLRFALIRHGDHPQAARHHYKSDDLWPSPVASYDFKNTYCRAICGFEYKPTIAFAVRSIDVQRLKVRQHWGGANRHLSPRLPPSKNHGSLGNIFMRQAR